MKKILLMAALCATVHSLKAQNTYPWPSSGNIGIGTTTPGFKLDVSGVINSSTYMSNAQGVYVDGGTGVGLNTNAGAQYMSFRTNNVDNRMVIDPNGNVGIGTTTPGYKLDVNGMGNFAGINFTAQSTVIPNVDISYGTIGTGKFIGQYFKSTDNQMHFYNGTGGADILQLDQNNNNVYVPYGNFGIGTLNPLAMLHVNGNIAALAATNTTNTYFLFQRPSDGYVGARIGNAYALDGYRGHLIFETNNGGNVTDLVERMRITSDGNVGIGTGDTHGYKLAVNGDIHTKKVVVDLINWPDYVFQPKYVLKPLSEIKTYIDQNHHLPDMPSAEKVEKDGLDLGEMNKTLVKKVEELTLYLIEKECEIKKQHTAFLAQQFEIEKLKKDMMKVKSKIK